MPGAAASPKADLGFGRGMAASHRCRWPVPRQWGSRAVEFGWTAGDLFDVPRDGKPGGLVWFLGGESVQAIGPRRMVTQDGRVFNRFEN